MTQRVALFVAVAFCLLWHAATLAGLTKTRFPRLSHSERRMIGFTTIAVVAAFALTLR